MYWVSLYFVGLQALYSVHSDAMDSSEKDFPREKHDIGLENFNFQIVLVGDCLLIQPILFR